MKNHGWFCGGDIQKLAMEAGYEPSNAARRLRELVEEGQIKVEYRQGKKKQKVAWYKYEAI